MAKLPQGAAHALGRALGRAAFFLDRPHRKIALENLKMALGGERGEREIRRLARASFVHLASSFVEVCRYRRLLEEPVERLVQFEGVERAAKVKAEGRGMILITGHLGSWELGALASPLIGYPLEVVYRPLDNPYLDRWLAQVRSSTGNRAVPKRNALRPILSSLQKGGLVVVLIDVNTMRSEGVFVDFFGRPACTTYAPALLALRTGAAVLPILTLRQDHHRLKVLVGEEIPLFRSGNLQRDLVENTANFTRVLEGYIREHPEQWFWPHERWKTRPKGRPRGEGQ
ncbi:MAG: lysophospholipid acyltransferase family protein, partial [candidate division NC10 bacterium]|nr:lysophospholipid acyltransferase family protein [candidate division NC10 bacterium]